MGIASQPAASFDWQRVLPSAKSLACMINTLRSRGNDDLAHKLHVLAEQQCRVQEQRLLQLQQEQQQQPKREEERSWRSKYLNPVPLIIPEPESSVQVQVVVMSKEEEEEKEKEERDERDEDEESLYSWISESDWNSDWDDEEEEIEGLLSTIFFIEK